MATQEEEPDELRIEEVFQETVATCCCVIPLRVGTFLLAAYGTAHSLSSYLWASLMVKSALAWSIMWLLSTTFWFFTSLFGLVATIVARYRLTQVYASSFIVNAVLGIVSIGWMIPFSTAYCEEELSIFSIKPTHSSCKTLGTVLAIGNGFFQAGLHIYFYWVARSFASEVKAGLNDYNNQKKVGGGLAAKDANATEMAFTGAGAGAEPLVASEL